MREDEMTDILHACHDGPCGGDFFDKRTAYKVLHSGYYWPSIFKDVAKYVKGCDSCQRMGRPMSADQMPLQPQVMIEPFEKWVEAKALFRATEKSVVEFIYEEIFTRFGVPREIVTDQGT